MAETAEQEEILGNHGDAIVGGAGWVRLAALRARRRWTAFILVALVVLLFAGIRWRVREMPLERDEGEYAYTGQLILQGIPPYKIAYNMKLPGTYVAYAAILRTFRETPAGVHLGLLLVNGCTTVLMFFLGRQVYGDLAGITAAASYAGGGELRAAFDERGSAGSGRARHTFCGVDGGGGTVVSDVGEEIQKSGGVFCGRNMHGTGVSDETAGNRVRHIWRPGSGVERIEAIVQAKEVGDAAVDLRDWSGSSVLAYLRCALSGGSVRKILVLDGFLCQAVRDVHRRGAGSEISA